MGAVKNGSKTEYEKFELVKRYQKLLKGAHERDYLYAIQGKSYGGLKPAEIYRMVQMYDNNHAAIEDAEKNSPIAPPPRPEYTPTTFKEMLNEKVLPLQKETD